MATSPWRTDGWRHDMAGIQAWRNEVAAPASNQSTREFCEYLANAFSAADTDNDGAINIVQFDCLLANVTSCSPQQVSKKFIRANNWLGSSEKILLCHKKIFDRLERETQEDGRANGLIRFDQFAKWALRHVARSVDTVLLDEEWPPLEGHSSSWEEWPTELPGGDEQISFYNHILKCFVQNEDQCKECFRFDQNWAQLLVDCGHAPPPPRCKPPPPPPSPPAAPPAVELFAVELARKGCPTFGIITNACAEGLRVREIRKGSPAESSGIKPFDVIIAVNGVHGDTLSMLDKLKHHDIASLQIMRPYPMCL